ncbi:hypothetical protein ILYODFUR_023223 [Ilyodon furcidens]|uniref:Uncharacterized protein n=1 Tax=Ilyodon furcidens TaxID=33524 RepID=A0ABV0T345_9TELE
MEIKLGSSDCSGLHNVQIYPQHCKCGICSEGTHQNFKNMCMYVCMLWWEKGVCGRGGSLHTSEITTQKGVDGLWPLGCQYNGVKIWDTIELQGDLIHSAQQPSLKQLS